MILTAQNILFIGSILLFLSIVVAKAGYKFGVPALLLFLGVGMLVGSDGLGIQFNSAATAQFVGVMALSIILFTGGMDTKYSEIKPVWREGVVLATLGVVLTAAITGIFIYYISALLTGYVSLTLMESFLLAAVMSSTDSASVFSLLRSKGLSLKENLRPTLELESGSNDPMAYVLTLMLIQIIQMGEMDAVRSVLTFLVQMSVGAVSGFFLGKLAVFVINKIDVNNQSFYPVLLLAFVFFVFSFTDMVKGNGYLAVYIAGLVVGNKKMVYKKSITTFFDGVTWLCQIVMFLTLGLLVNPSELLPVALIGLLVAVFMIVVSRPVSVFISLAPFRKISTKARWYISWVGLRGAVPIIFATYPLLAGIGHAQMMFNIVFFITIVSLLVQGTTVGFMARKLGLAHPEKKDVNNFGLELPEEIKSAMSEIEVTPSILENGDHLMDLPLPDNTLVVMIKRDGQFFIPKGKTRLLPGDRLLVISDDDRLLRQTYQSLGIVNYSIKKN